MSRFKEYLTGKSQSFLAKHLRLDVADNTRLDEIGRWSDRDIFVAGYPKSGNTWFQELAAACLYGTDPAVTPHPVIQDMVPDVHYKRYFRRYGDEMVFKTHDLPQPEHRRVVMLVRDGRDVMVSYFHYLQAMSEAALDFSEFVTTGKDVYPCQWHEHVTAWLENPYSAEILTIRYEDLLEALPLCLQRFCDFAGIERDPEELQWIAKRARFHKLKSKEKKQGLENWNNEAPFFRRGVAGSFRDEMPPHVLDAFMQQARPALQAAGYLTTEAA